MSKKVKSIDGLMRYSELGVEQVSDSPKVIRRHSGGRKRQAVVENTTSIEEVVEETKQPEVFGVVETIQPGARELGDFTSEPTVEELAKAELEFSSDEMEKEIKSKEKELKKEKKAKKAKKKWSKKRKVLTVLLVLLIIAGGAVGALLIWGNDVISKITNGESGIWDVLTIKDKDVKLKTDGNGRTNLLVFGTSGYDMGGSNHDGAQLTDSIMVVSLDQETKDVAMLSLPRDLLVSRTCTATGKINEIYWCYNQDGTAEIAGADALKAEVQDILGVQIQYYAHINWGALVALVDSVGGITVTLDEDIADPWTNTYIDAGVPTQLNGEQALGLARARHGTASGDFTRGNSQQKILIALKDKLTQSGVGVTDMINIINSLGDNLRMSANLDEIKTTYNVMKELDLASIRQVPLVSADGTGENYMTTAEINGISYVIPMAGVQVYSDLQAYVAKMFSSDPAAREDATIMVLNGTETPGAASTEQTKLTNDGYNVTIIDDAPAGEYTKSYYVYKMNDNKPGTAKSLAKRYGVKVQGVDKLPEGIDGTWVDFVIILGK